MPPIGVSEVLGTHEEGLKTFFSTGDDGCVITEEQSAQYGHQYDAEEIGFATVLLLVHNDNLIILLDDCQYRYIQTAKLRIIFCSPKKM